MFNYFLHPSFLAHADFDQLFNCMLQLSSVQMYHQDIYDHFYKDSSLSNVEHDCGETVIKTLFERVGDEQFRYTALPIILNKLRSVTLIDSQIDSVNAVFGDKKNSFWGAVFPDKKPYYLSSVDDYLLFRKTVVDEVSINDIWMTRHFLFPKVDFCTQTKKEFEAVRKVDLFHSVVDSLKKLSVFVEGWSEGNFDMEALAKTVDASYESKTTIDQFKKEHTFKINDTIGKKVCSAHLKVDTLRIHFYPDNDNHKVYVAYIGPHLSTHKFKK